MDYSKKGEVNLSMEGYLRAVLEYFLEKIIGRANMLTSNHLLKIQNGEEQVLLDKQRARAFHHSIAQLLFTSTMIREDIQTTVAFLTTQVRAPDEDD